ncbi:MAG: FecR domain-containing protein [Desulfobacterales bacterium]|nr:FecR domain-containing protein [Desulfobacterales bacterium]
MKKRFFIITVAVLFIFSTGMAFGSPVGKFTAVKGMVDLTAPDGSLREVKMGDPVSVGDIVRTKSKSTAEITFADDSVVRLARNSRLQINEYMIGKEETRGILKLFRGKAQSIISKAAGFFGLKNKNKFEMHTPTAVCGVRGTNFFTWYNQGQSGLAVKEGTVYNYAANKPNQVKSVRAGQSSIVVSGDEEPVIGTATDEDLSLGDDDEGGSPAAFVGDEDPEELFSFSNVVDDPDVDDGDTTKIIPEVADTYVPDFELLLTGGFLDGTLTGDFTLGTLALNAAYPADAAAANAMAVGGDLANGGALKGYLGGTLGSWEGLFTSIFMNPDGGAGFSIGTLSGDVTDSQLTASGGILKGEVLGNIPGADAAGFELELEDWGDFPTPGFSEDDTAMVEGVETVNAENDRPLFLGIYNTTGSGDLNLDSGYGNYRQSGLIDYEEAGGQNYLLMGYVKVENDGAGHVSINDFGNLSYLDPLYHGTYTLGVRWADDGEGSGEYITAGTIELEPLDFSTSLNGSFHESTLFFDDSGSKGVAGDARGIMGFVDNGSGYDLYAAGAYEMDYDDPAAPLIWHSYIGNGLLVGPDLYNTADAGYGGGESGLLGATAGLWRPQNGYSGLMTGAVAGIRQEWVDDGLYIERFFGGLGGDYFPDPDADNLAGLWRAEGTADVDSMTVAEEEDFFMHYGVMWAQLGGSFGGDTVIEGRGLGEAFSFLDLAEDESLGIFTLGLGNFSGELPTPGNDYTGTAGAWSGHVGGLSIGETEGFDEYYLDRGFFLAEVKNGTMADNGDVKAILDGEYMTTTHMADLYGALYGQQTPAGGGYGGGTWIAHSVGTLDNVRALTLSQAFGVGRQGQPPLWLEHFDSDEGALEEVGELSGLLGSADPFLTGTGADIATLSLGKFIGDEFYTAGFWDATIGVSGLLDEVGLDVAIPDPIMGDLTPEGGAYYGFYSGIRNGAGLEGMVTSLYADEDGNVGIHTGNSSGSLFADVDMFRMTGTLDRQQVAADVLDPYDFQEYLSYDESDGGDFYGGLAGDFDAVGTGIVAVTGGFSTAWLDYEGLGQTAVSTGAQSGAWGIYSGRAAGYQNGPVNNGDWSARVGASAAFGGYGGSYGGYSYDYGTYIGTTDNETWTGNRMSADTSGRFITSTRMADTGAGIGDISGRLIGTYDPEDGTWEMVTQGTFEGEDLSYYNYFSANIRSYNGSYLQWTGDLWEGRMGHADSLWGADPARVMIMGQYYSNEDTSSIWYYSNSNSYNALDDSSTTYDSGAYSGYMGGIHNNGALEGGWLALYLDPAGNGSVGILSSADLEGAGYNDLDLYEMDGTVVRSDPKITDTGITADDFVNSYVESRYTDYSYSYGGLSGSVGSGETVYGGYGGGYGGGLSTQYVDTDYNGYGGGEDWGIYSQTLYGEMGAGTSTQAAEDAPAWSATITGGGRFGDFNQSNYDADDSGLWIVHTDDDTAEWAGSRFAADVSGRFLTQTKMGTMEGRILGTYHDAIFELDGQPPVGFWEAVHMGTWDGIEGDLAFFSGNNDGLELMYAYDSGSIYPYTYATLYDYHMGGTQSLWNATDTVGVPVTLMSGLTGSPADQSRGIWTDGMYSSNYIKSYNAMDYTSTTYDGGAYMGYLGGIRSGDTLAGGMVGLYVDGDYGHVGVLYSDDWTGTIYADSRMAEMDGHIYREQRGTDTFDLPSGDFINMAVVTDRGYGGLAGEFVFPDIAAYSEDGDGLASDPSTGYGGIRTASIYYGGLDDSSLWGIYAQDAFGGYNGGDGADGWTGETGGKVAFGHDQEGLSGSLDYGFWSGKIDDGDVSEPAAGDWNAGGTFDGTFTGRFMTRVKMGDPMAGTGGMFGQAHGTWGSMVVAGGDAYGGVDGTWELVNMGTWEGTDLSYFSEFSSNTHYAGYGGSEATSGSLSGYLGHTDSLWDGTDARMTIMGYFNESGGAGSIWYDSVYTQNVISGSFFAYEGGSYYAYLGGIKTTDGDLDLMEGAFYGLSIDDIGYGGFLVSRNLDGGIADYAYNNSGDALLEMDGTVAWIDMDSYEGTGTAVYDFNPDTNIGWSETTVFDDGFYGEGSESEMTPLQTTPGYYGSLSTNLGYGGMSTAALPERSWGIWNATLYGGGYTNGDETVDMNDWILQLDQSVTGFDRWINFDGTEWTEITDAAGKMAADGAGAWVDLTHAVTGVMGGTLKGTFDPGSAATWEAIAAGAYLDTETFLAMVDSEAGKSALHSLNIPSFEVGQVDMSYTGGATVSNEITSLSLDNVTFLSHTSGGAAAIWATNGVSGSYDGDPSGDSKLVSGGGLDATFTINNWAGSNWDASISGGGTPSGVGAMDGTAISMTGAAAGAIDSGTAFSGTASGVVRPPVPSVVE